MANQRLSENAKGVFAISATPFTDSGAVDEASTDSMVDFYLESGVSGLTILGVMGEAPKMSPDESSAFCRQVLRRVDGRVPVVATINHPSAVVAEQKAREAQKLGAAAIMSLPPFFGRWRAGNAEIVRCDPHDPHPPLDTTWP